MQEKIGILLFLAVLYAGCDYTPIIIKHVAHTQSLNIVSTISPPPVKLANDTSLYRVRISPRFSIFSNSNITGNTGTHTSVDANGNFQVDTVMNNGSSYFVPRDIANKYVFLGNNVFWKLQQFSSSIDIDFNAKKNAVFSLGTNYAWAENQTRYGWSMGVANYLPFKNDNLRGRIEAGIKFQKVSYNINYIIETKNDYPVSDYVEYHNKSNESTRMNFYTTIMLNTARKDWKYNYFFQFGLFGNPVASTDSPTLSGATPGVIFDDGNNNQFLVGIQVLFIPYRNLNTQKLILPFVQYDWNL